MLRLELPEFEENDLRQKILDVLPAALTNYEEIAQSVGADPWTVLFICRQLIATGDIEEGTGISRSSFKNDPIENGRELIAASNVRHSRARSASSAVWRHTFDLKTIADIILRGGSFQTIPPAFHR